MVKIYDIETLANCFTLTAIEAKNDVVDAFVVHKLRDDREALYKWLKDQEMILVGFNNLKFDYPVLHRMIKEEYKIMRMTAENAARYIYRISQEILSMERPEIRWKWVLIPQLDVYRVHHFDNKAKHASLKWVQIGLKWKNVQDMPIHHTTLIETLDEIEIVLEYNLNDVLSTRSLYLSTRKQIDMRKALRQRYNIEILNANDPKIGQELILKMLADKKQCSVWDLKKMQTHRTEVHLAECILPGIKFETKAFQKVHEKMRSTILTNISSDDKLKNKMKATAIVGGMQYVFGLGGLHGCLKSTTYYSSEKYDIMSCDVSSYYPHIAIRNGFHPEHLGFDFCEVYEFVYDERKKFPKKSPENEGLKLALNGAFGKSNDKHSPFLDSRFTMQITVNGQLMLAMLCEEIVTKGIGRILMANTDGIEVEVPVEKREEYRQVCLAWEEKWKMPLEHKRYKVLATRDVNNYIGIFEDGEVKCKGAYEVDKPLHKDPSMRIVSLAVREYIVNGTPIERTINGCGDKYDFMIAARSKEDAHFELRRGDTRRKLGKTNRYVVSPSGDYIFKVYDTGEEERVSSGYPITLLNRFVTLDEVKIDRQYYIMEANKLLFPLIETQMSLML